MNTNLITNLTRFVGKSGLKLKKHSPEILIVAGVVGVVTSAVMACKATTKATEIVEEAKEQIDNVHQCLENPDIPEEKYSEEDSKKDLAIIYIQTGIKFIKLYGPSVLLGVASITSILASNNILRKRNVALASAYAVLDKGFKDYRERVVERFGKDLDRELRYNIRAKEITETTIDENGKEQTVTKTVNVVGEPNEHSDYARFYDDGCTGWEKDPEFNLMFLRRQQDHANEMLKSRGYLFLNEVYKMLGIPVTKAGQCVGWIYDEKNPSGDNFVDFGIYDQDVNESDAERKRAFVNGYERTILLDFNVYGNILDLI